MNSARYTSKLFIAFFLYQLVGISMSWWTIPQFRFHPSVSRATAIRLEAVAHLGNCNRSHQRLCGRWHSSLLVESAIIHHFGTHRSFWSSNWTISISHWRSIIIEFLYSARWITVGGVVLTHKSKFTVVETVCVFKRNLVFISSGRIQLRGRLTHLAVAISFHRRF